MLRKALWALLVFKSVTFAASVNYLASISCNADGSAPLIVSGSTPGQGFYRNCTGGSEGIAETSQDSSGPTQDNTAQYSGNAYGTGADFAVSFTSISDPNMSIVNTGLPNGTPLIVEETWSATGYYSYEPSDMGQPNPNAVSSIGGYLQVSVDGMGPSTAYIQPAGCAYGVSFCNLQGYGGASDALNVVSSFQTTVGGNFPSTVSLESIAGSSAGAQVGLTFYSYPELSSAVRLSSLNVTNGNTGQVISSAILEGSNGPYLVTASDVPEIDANSAAGAIALIAGILLIYCGRKSPPIVKAWARSSE